MSFEPPQPFVLDKDSVFKRLRNNNRSMNT